MQTSVLFSVPPWEIIECEKVFLICNSPTLFRVKRKPSLIWSIRMFCVVSIDLDG